MSWVIFVIRSPCLLVLQEVVCLCHSSFRADFVLVPSGGASNTDAPDDFTSQLNGRTPWQRSYVGYRLKLYIDIITQPGLLFGFDPAHGYSGLLQGKRATAIYTAGVYGPGAAPAFGTDHHATYFDDWLRFIGIEDISTVRYQPNILTADPAGGLVTAREVAGQAGAR
jgi:hypothetical protein